MKTYLTLFVASLGFASVCFANQPRRGLPTYEVTASANEAEALKWVYSYYQNPRPAEFARNVHLLSQAGYFEQAGQPAQAIGFFSQVFAKNPEFVNFWMAETRSLPEKHQRILASALWLSGNPRGEALIRRQMTGVSEAVRTDLAALLAKKPSAGADTPVDSRAAMDLQWGAFLATGSELHITNILASLGSGQRGIAESARLSLALNAAEHPRVLEICRAQLDKQPNEVRLLLKAAINDAQPAARQPSS
jgi:hypothetical protein